MINIINDYNEFQGNFVDNRAAPILRKNTKSNILRHPDNENEYTDENSYAHTNNH